MTQENQEVQDVEPKPTQEQIVAQVNAFREAIVKSAVDNKLSYDVVFNSMSQAICSFTYDFLLVSQGELSEANVAETVGKFNEQTLKVAALGLENMREAARAAQAEQAQENSQV